MIRAINEHVARTQDPQAPGLGAVAAHPRAVKGRVLESSVGGEGHESVGSRLEIRRLGLQLRGVDVLGIGELVLVEDVVLDGGADEPEAACGGLDVEPAAGVDCDLRVGGVVDVVIGSPEKSTLANFIHLSSTSFDVWMAKSTYQSQQFSIYNPLDPAVACRLM